MKKSALVVVVALLLSAFSVWLSFQASPLPAPEPFAGVIPPATPPATMTVVRLLTGVTHRNAGIAYRGGSLQDKRDFAMSATLVRHPRGDLLIDTGLGRGVERQFKEMPAWFRTVTLFTRGLSASEQLDAAHYDRQSLRAILLTHAHWDHVSGIADFPGIPVLVTPEEHRFIDHGGWITQVARGIKDVRYEEYGFEAGPFLGFARSHDVFGDGSVVVVPAAGHTPGSVIVFVTLPSEKRYAFLGDLAWQREGITELEERPWLIRSLADQDPAGVREGILRIAAIRARLPDLVLVPAHDSRAFAEMPELLPR